jgi:hypothetical protein
MSLRLWSPNITFSNGYRQAYFVNEDLKVIQRMPLLFLF